MTATSRYRTASASVATCRAVRHPAVISVSFALQLLENRHCLRSANHWPALQWLDDRRAEMLDTQYFHVVFTLPAELAAIALCKNKAVVCGILFRTVAKRTLRTIAADPKASWCGDRLLRRSPHVGVQFVTPSASARGRARRWAFAGMETDGSLAGLAISLPVQDSLGGCSGGFFTESSGEAVLRRRSVAHFSPPWLHLKERDAFQRYLAPVRRAEIGGSMQSARSPDRSRKS